MYPKQEINFTQFATNTNQWRDEGLSNVVCYYPLKSPRSYFIDHEFQRWTGQATYVWRNIQARSPLTIFALEKQ